MIEALFGFIWLFTRLMLLRDDRLPIRYQLTMGAVQTIAIFVLFGCSVSAVIIWLASLIVLMVHEQVSDRYRLGARLAALVVIPVTVYLVPSGYAAGQLASIAEFLPPERII